MEQKFNEGKFRELILYIAGRSVNDQHFGAVKLNKILYFSDFNAYRELGSSITGADYQHLNEGPAPREFLRIKDSLIEQEEANIEHRIVFSMTQQRLIAMRPAKDVFTPDERRIIDEVIETLWDMTARQASRLSHEDYGWRLTEPGESIPYSSAFFSPEPLTQEQLRYGQRFAEEHGLRA
ncbi:MAG: SocA family protein [SAR202 cluster bacterium]|nr:SocA family protein [SAR202 cluster bacterium]